MQVLHTQFPRIFVARRKPKNRDQALLVIRIHNRLTYAYYFEHRELCLWHHLRGLNLAERYYPTHELAHAYSIHAPVMGLIAFFRRGVAYAQKSLTIHTRLGNVLGQGQALSFHGLILYAASRFEECIEKSREAVSVLERAGDLWEVNVARVHVAFCLFKLGDLAACRELAKRVHFSGVELGDAKASGFSLDVWAWSTGGKVPAEILQTELKRPREDAQVTVQVIMAEGVRLFMLDRVDEAAQVFARGNQLAKEAGLTSTYVLPHRSWHASALRRLAEITRRSEDRATVLGRASRTARKAVRIARKFQNDLPHALREAGLISALQSSNRKARKHLDESLHVAERQGAKFEYAQTLLARGLVGQGLGWPTAAEDVAAARKSLIDMGAEFAIAYYSAQEPTEFV